MPEMTANGMKMMMSNGDEVIISLGDEVQLVSGYVGVVFNWTRRGVGVRLDQGPTKIFCRGLAVLAFDVGDREIRGIVRHAEPAPPRTECGVDRSGAFTEPPVPRRDWSTDEILRREG